MPSGACFLQTTKEDCPETQNGNGTAMDDSWKGVVIKFSNCLMSNTSVCVCPLNSSLLDFFDLVILMSSLLWPGHVYSVGRATDAFLVATALQRLLKLYAFAQGLSLVRGLAD